MQYNTREVNQGSVRATSFPSSFIYRRPPPKKGEGGREMKEPGNEAAVRGAPAGLNWKSIRAMERREKNVIIDVPSVKP